MDVKRLVDWLGHFAPRRGQWPDVLVRLGTEPALPDELRWIKAMGLAADYPGGWWKLTDDGRELVLALVEVERRTLQTVAKGDAVNEAFDKATEAAQAANTAADERWTGETPPQVGGAPDGFVSNQVMQYADHLSPIGLGLVLQAVRQSLKNLAGAGHPSRELLETASETLGAAESAIKRTSPPHRHASAAILRRLNRQARERREAEQAQGRAERQGKEVG